MKYSEKLPKEDREFYSINFLLAEFDEIKIRKDKTQILETLLNCDFYKTCDFKSIPYYKNISTIVQHFENDTDN